MKKILIAGVLIIAGCSTNKKHIDIDCALFENLIPHKITKCPTYYDASLWINPVFNSWPYPEQKLWQECRKESR